MSYQLVQVNIAKFRLPQDHIENADFINNLDRINNIAENQPGFIWRFTGAENDALDIQAFDDPHIAINMSVWDDVSSLMNFVYRNEDHINIMRRRKEWFDKLDFHMVLWWVESGRKPTVNDAIVRLDTLQRNGPSHAAFTFRKPYPAPSNMADNPLEIERT